MKRRLSASIDEDLLAAAERAVEQGRAPSVSALVEEALAERIAHDQRLQAADEFFARMDDEWGPLTDRQEALAQAEIDANSFRVRPDGTSGKRDAA